MDLGAGGSGGRGQDQVVVQAVVIMTRLWCSGSSRPNGYGAVVVVGLIINCAIVSGANA